jgi:hypothetical protein
VGGTDWRSLDGTIRVNDLHGRVVNPPSLEKNSGAAVPAVDLENDGGDHRATMSLRDDMSLA